VYNGGQEPCTGDGYNSRVRVALLVILIISVSASAAARQATQPPPADAPPPPQFSEAVEVVAVTPVHGLEVPKTKVAANVQIFTPPRVPALAPSDASRLLAERAVSVHTTDAQAGTFQPDVLFRGFTGSPLLGSSEGLAVYQDGVRMNEAFGDTINWDVLPSNAIGSLNLIPGSNPLFGLNALGGALSIRTKDGFTAPGGRGAVRGGSFGRYDIDAESGGRHGAFGYYLAGSLIAEDGWRDHSPSTVRKLFGDAGWRGTDSQVHISFTGASNDLTANGPAPVELLDEDYEAVFTYPDETDNDVAMLAAKFLGRRDYGQLDGVAYYRYSASRTFNGDALDEDDESGFTAINNRSHTRTQSAGFTGQLSRREPLAGRDNNLVIGAGLDTAATRFDFNSEWAHLTDDRGTIGSGTFDEDAAVDLHSRATTASAFATNIWSPTARLALTASARFNWTEVNLRDQLGTALTGDHRFSRLNPAGGVTFQAAPQINLYGSYTQSSRVPTPVELTCADPEDPCRLPNAFLSDPPLDQIVASTWEGGARGVVKGASWSLAAYHTSATDDIIFVSSGTLRGEGHFENVDSTIRRGIEAGVNFEHTDRFSAFATYTLQRAVFGTDLVIASQFHPLAVESEIPVAEGSSLPGIPRHSGKFGLAGRIGRLDAGFTVRAQSGQYLRGDEANLLVQAPGFATADAHGRYRFNDKLSLVGQVTNLFDTRYYTFGVLGDATLIDDGLEHARFYSPGAPRGAWIGAEVGF
jgi:iron complex outermembrane receptor protein